MKISKFILFALILIFTLQLIQAEPAQEEKKITWYSLEEGLPLAKEQQKFIFIDFYTTWCGYCKKMDKDVFSKAEVIDLLNNDYIAVKVNGDSPKVLDIDGYKISEKDLSHKEFKVTGYPTYWWLTPAGKKLHSQSGYAPADFWIKALTQIKGLEVDSLGNVIQPKAENN